MRQDELQRLECIGCAAYLSAEKLLEVLERYPVDDRLARRLRALEQEARGIAGEMLMELREAEGALP
ncbi:MAG TPA: hypothetical protein VMK42_11925 [Anaeromyxobacteraceae bacterium]|nr:hypothetical protein [Anaeromyxobacteraceae bacterium]